MPPFVQIENVLARKRRSHPELRRSPTYSSLRRVCERESITIIETSASASRGYSYDGERTILLSSSEARDTRTYRLLREMAKLWLAGKTEPATSAEQTDAEADAEVFCLLTFRQQRRVDRPLFRRVVASIQARPELVAALVLMEAVLQAAWLT
jgi:hypothetical protein